MQQVTIRPGEAGQRFDKFLRKYFKEASGDFIYKMLRKKNITLNARKATGSERLCAGDVATFFFSDETFARFRGHITPEKKRAGYADKEYGKTEYEKTGYGKSGRGKAEYRQTGYGRTDSLYQEGKAAYRKLGRLPILYENAHILLVDKPQGVLSQKAAADDLSLNEWLIGYLLQSGGITTEELDTFHPSVCNRLDRNTSGIVICGKSLRGSQQMSRILKDRSLHKYYMLYVAGQLREAGRIEGYLYKDTSANKVQILKEQLPGSARIETVYRPVAAAPRATLVEAELITGKPHQLRAHFSSIGFPIIGDPKYGDRAQNDFFRKKYAVTRQLLHAYRVVFPVLDGDMSELSGMEVRAPLPADFQRMSAQGS